MDKQINYTVMNYCKLKPVQTTQSEMRIGIIGSILNEQKGCKIVCDFLKKIKNTEIQICFIGSLKLSCKFLGKNIQDMGKYAQNELGEKIHQSGINTIWFPSIWSKTFSCLISELILLDIPVACFRLGAQTEKIQNYKYGKIIPNFKIESIIDSLKEAF